MEDRDTIKKQTRMVENDRQKYQAAVKQQLQKQSDTISALKKENDKLKQEVASKTGGSYKFTEQDKTTLIQQEMESLERKVNFEKMRQRDLDKKLAVSRMDLSRARKNMGGVNITTENITLIDKQVRVLENRLDQALVQFNEALAYNRELRQQIDNLRGERKVFTEIYRKLEADLHDKKKKMADIIERSNRDYEERDALKTQLETLRGAAKEDSKKYDEHFQRLDEMMLKYKQLKDQQHQQQLQQQSQQQSQKSPTKTQKHDDSRKDDAGRKKHLPQDAKAHSTDDASLEDPEEADLAGTIEWVKRETEMSDLDELHRKFVKSEEQNFSTYNFVNELNTEAEGLDSDIAALREELAKQRGDSDRSATLKALENELAVTETQHDSIQEKTAKAREILESVRASTQEIFTKINCSTKMAAELCGTTEVNEINLLTFLGIIEHRTNELLFSANRASDQDRRKQRAGQDEEKRRKREQQEADRQARRDAGEAVDDDDHEDDDVDDSVPATESRAQFVGVGPSSAHGSNTAKALVAKEALPTTNVNDAVGGDGHEDVDDEEPLDHNKLRAKMEERLKEKRNTAKKKNNRKK